MILKRTVQKLVRADWVDIQSLYDLEIGDKFRMFEQDGTPVTWDGVDNWLALELAYTDEHGVEGIRCS